MEASGPLELELVRFINNVIVSILVQRLLTQIRTVPPEEIGDSEGDRMLPRAA
jgi:hypothetical protein